MQARKNRAGTLFLTFPRNFCYDFLLKLAQLQSKKRDDTTNKSNHPHAQHDFAIFKTFFLIMMMNRRAKKKAFAASAFVINALQNSGSGFDDKNKSRHDKQKRLSRNNRDRADPAADPERSDIAHVNFGGFAVVPQKRHHACCKSN